MSNSLYDLKVKREVISDDRVRIGELIGYLQLVVVDGNGGSVLDTLTHYLGFFQSERQAEFLTGL